LSLGLAKRLKELGVKQESYWYWAVHENGTVIGLEHQTYPKTVQHAIDYYAAFTVAELDDFLGFDHGAGHFRPLGIIG